MLQFAVDQGQLAENPAKEVKVRVRKKVKERDKGFDGEEAATILLATLREPSDKISIERWRRRGVGCPGPAPIPARGSTKSRR